MPRRADLVRDAVSQCRHLLEQGDPARAIDVVMQASTLDPDHPELKQLLGQAQRRQAVASAQAEAAENANRQKYSSAISILESALKQWPDESALSDSLQKYRQQHALIAVVQQSKDLAKAGRYADALNVTRAGLVEYPNDPRLLDLCRGLEEHFASAQRAEAIRRALEDGRALLLERHADQAIHILQRASGQFPDDSQLKLLLAEAHETLAAEQRRGAVEKAGLAATQKADRGDFAGAVGILESALQSWPGEESLLSLLDKTQQARALFERQLVIQNLTKQVNSLAAQNRYTDALDLVRQGLPELIGVQKQLQDEIARRETAAAVEKILTSSRVLLEKGELQEAVEKLGKACAEYPGQQRLTQLLAQAQSALQRQRSREGVARATKEAETLIAKDDFTGAVHMLQRALESWPGENNLAELLRDAQRRQSIKTVAEQAEKLAAANRPRKALKIVQSALLTHGSDPLLVSLEERLQSAASGQPAPYGRILLAGGLLAVVLAAAFAVPRIFKGDHRIAIGFESNIAGASIGIGGQSCITPDCTLNLSPGEYKLVAMKDGFTPLEQSLAVKADSRDIKIPVTLTPLPQRIQINTNFAAGQVLIDGKLAGDLRDGQFSVDGVSAGSHVLRVTGSDAEFDAEWKAGAGAAPELTRPIGAKNVQATLLANAGKTGTLACNCGPGSIQVDGHPVGTFSEDARLRNSEKLAGRHPANNGSRSLAGCRRSAESYFECHPVARSQCRNPGC